jgi:hypothetical protein
MIEPIESSVLYSYARNLTFQEGDAVVEFGTFFGRSTNAISQGLKQNLSFSINGKFYAYDSFACSKSGSFAPHVEAFAEKGGVDHLIQYCENGTIDFLPIFSHYLKDYVDASIVNPVRAELVESKPYSNSIVLMHIDSPKYYEEFKIILFDFVPKMNKGGIIIFQDFFFHWSATLIAVIGILLDKKYIEITQTAASSLVCKVIKSVEFNNAVEIDALMKENASKLEAFIDKAIEHARRLPRDRFDRPNQFFQRLGLARAQYMHENGNIDGAKLIFLQLIEFCEAHKGTMVEQQLIADILDLRKFNHSVRELYELDHNL